MRSCKEKGKGLQLVGRASLVLLFQMQIASGFHSELSASHFATENVLQPIRKVEDLRKL